MAKPTRRGFLIGGMAAAAGSIFPWIDAVSAQAQGTATKNLVVLYASGGWDASACLDPKVDSPMVDSPPGDVTMFGDIPILTGPERPAVGDFFTRYGSMSAVVRGIGVRSIAHEECAKRILTGTNNDRNPDLGAIAGFENGGSLPVPYMVLGQQSYTGEYTGSSGRTGLIGQLSTLLATERAYRPPIGTRWNRFAPDGAEASLIRQYVTGRADKTVARRGAHGLNKLRLSDYRSALDRSDALRPLVDAFSENQGFQLELIPQIELGVRVLKDGISKSVLIEDPSEWDTHDNNDERQFANLQNLYTHLQLLLEELETANILEETVVVVVSEMSRTPLKNDNNGKDHWPVTSALVVGAGVNGGRAFGGTTDDVQSVLINPATGMPDSAGQELASKQFVAGVLDLVGVDSSQYFAGVSPLHGIIA